MKQLNNRQYQIYNFIRAQGSAANNEIKDYLSESFEKISRVTIVRDIELLLKSKYIKKTGAGRSTRYTEYNNNTLLRYFDSATYFKTESDNRTIKEHFNFDIFQNFSKIFTGKELKTLESLTQEYRKNLSKIQPDIYRREIERLTIELSWKSSQIEGNTYSLLDTEVLIKENKEATGHKKEEAVMILNHKKALDYIFAHNQDYKKISVRKIEDIHRLLVEELAINHGIRNSLVNIIGTKYKPLNNKQQISEAVENMTLVINNYPDPFHKSLTAIVLLSYIQPFIDGNKRTARLVGNSILTAQNACPLSYRSIDPVEYKKAILLFYEQNSLHYFKDLYINQYEFSVKNYFLS